jgi:hypothetical protein
MEDPQASALEKFVASARTPENIQERFEHEVCKRLVNETTQILETAPVTTAFKSFVLGNIIKAYVYESKIDDAISPARLGLLEGEGIFDAAKSGDIEGQVLRGFLYDIVNRQLRITDEPDARVISLNPAEYTQLVAAFDQWSLDYIAAYGTDALEGVDVAAFMAAAPHVVNMSEAEAGAWAEIFKKLRRSRKEE